MDERTRTATANALDAHQTPGRSLVSLAWAGIAGPLLFTIAVIGQEIARHDDFDPMADPISALEAGPSGWVQQLNFVVFGLFTLAFAVGLHRGIRPSRRGVLGPALVGVSGIGLLMAAALPLREDSAGDWYDPGLHWTAGVAFFSTSAVSLIVLSRRLRRDPAWSGLSTYALAAGLVAFAGFVATGLLVVPEQAPLHDWGGIAQFVLLLGVTFPCRVTLAIRLRQVARAGG